MGQLPAPIGVTRSTTRSTPGLLNSFPCLFEIGQKREAGLCASLQEPELRLAGSGPRLPHRPDAARVRVPAHLSGLVGGKRVFQTDLQAAAEQPGRVRGVRASLLHRRARQQEPPGRALWYETRREALAVGSGNEESCFSSREMTTTDGEVRLVSVG